MIGSVLLCIVAITAFLIELNGDIAALVWIW